MKQEISYYKSPEIHLVLQEDGTIQSSVQNLTFDLMLRMTIPFIVSKATEIYNIASKQTSPKVPALTKQQLQALKEAMYDGMNIAFSNALDSFAPEIEARPNLSADAIYRAQQELLKEDMARLGYDPKTGEKIKEDTK